MKLKTVCLTEVVEIEPRPTKGKIYPVGTIIIQISATKGQVLYLRTPSQIEEKYAVLIPKEDIEPFYLFTVIKKFFPKFFYQYRQGLNLKAEVLAEFYFPLHQDKNKQQQIIKMLRCFGGSIKDFYQNPYA